MSKKVERYPPLLRARAEGAARRTYTRARDAAWKVLAAAESFGPNTEIILEGFRTDDAVAEIKKLRTSDRELQTTGDGPFRMPWERWIDRRAQRVSNQTAANIFLIETGRNRRR